MRWRPAKKLRQFVAQFLAQLVVEIGERLVEQDEVAVLDERAGDRRALLLSAGKLGRPALQHRRQAEKIGRLARPLASISAGGHAGDAEGRGDVLVDGEIGVVDELLVDHRDVALLHRHAADVLAAEEYLAGGRPLEPGHDLHQRRLAGERRAEKDVERALAQVTRLVSPM